MSALPKKKYTVEEYLQMELTAPYKSEYYNGEIFPMGEIEGDTPEAMAGALPPHNAISSNIIIAFGNRLRGTAVSLLVATKEFLSLKLACTLILIFLFFAELFNTRII